MGPERRVGLICQNMVIITRQSGQSLNNFLERSDIKGLTGLFSISIKVSPFLAKIKPLIKKSVSGIQQEAIAILENVSAQISLQKEKQLQLPMLQRQNRQPQRAKGTANILIELKATILSLYSGTQYSASLLKMQFLLKKPSFSWITKRVGSQSSANCIQYLPSDYSSYDLVYLMHPLKRPSLPSFRLIKTKMLNKMRNMMEAVVDSGSRAGWQKAIVELSKTEIFKRTLMMVPDLVEIYLHTGSSALYCRRKQNRFPDTQCTHSPPPMLPFLPQNRNWMDFYGRQVESPDRRRAFPMMLCIRRSAWQLNSKTVVEIGELFDVLRAVHACRPCEQAQQQQPDFHNRIINIVALALREIIYGSNFQMYAQLQPVLVVGDSAVGKTTAVRRLIGRPFPTKVVPTVAYQFYFGHVQIAGEQVKLNFWDMSGQKSKISLALSYLPEVDAVIVVYDLTSFATFHSASYWVDTQKRQLPIFLFGNKLDLCYKGQGREVKGQQLELMKKVVGVSRIGSGLVDSSFEKGLIELIQKYLITDIVFQGEENAKHCCCK